MKRTASALPLQHTGIHFVLQAEQRGTGHALMVARQALAGYDHVIVLSGDAPHDHAADNRLPAETFISIRSRHDVAERRSR